MEWIYCSNLYLWFFATHVGFIVPDDKGDSFFSGKRLMREASDILVFEADRAGSSLVFTEMRELRLKGWMVSAFVLREAELF
jgi:hypothetical protein